MSFLYKLGLKKSKGRRTDCDIYFKSSSLTDEQKEIVEDAGMKQSKFDSDSYTKKEASFKDAIDLKNKLRKTNESAKEKLSKGNGYMIFTYLLPILLVVLIIGYLYFK